MRRENLDGHCALKPRVAGAIHLAHPARANRVQDLVGSQPSSWGQWHLAAILHLRDRIQSGKRPPNKREDVITREKSASVYR